MNFSAQRSSAVVFALAAQIAAYAQGFGRFGYQEIPALPGFIVDRSGFRAKNAVADELRFEDRLKQWQPVLISPFGMTVSLDDAPGQPSKVRFDLLGPGFSLYYPSGIRLRTSATASPYLTWTDGSVDHGVPTPKTKWIALSFHDKQPAIVFAFPTSPCDLVVKGKPGAWSVTSDPKFSGWVRVGLPLGLEPFATNSASSLGKLAAAVASEGDLWTRPIPSFQHLDVSSDALSVTATWTFSGPGAVIPVGAMLAYLGGYPLTIRSESQRLPMPLDDGPTDILKGNTLEIRLPVKQVPTGRFLASGAGAFEPIATASPDDVPSIAEMALSTLSSGRDAQSRKTAEDALSEYLADVPYFKERWTGQNLPFDGAGKGLALAAAQALLMQSLLASESATSDANSLMTSVTWIQDWRTWLPWTADEAAGRRTASLAALTGALCPEAQRRLTAAMMQAGLSAQRGLDIWRRREGLITTLPQHLESWLGVRQALFGLTGDPESGFDYGMALQSPYRVVGIDPVSMSPSDAQGLPGSTFLLSWPALEPKPSVFNLLAPFEPKLTSMENLDSLQTSFDSGSLQVRYTPTIGGQCVALLTLAPGSLPPPKAAAIPRYVEVMK